VIGKSRLNDADDCLLRGEVSLSHQIGGTFLANRESLRPLPEHLAAGAGGLEGDITVEVAEVIVHKSTDRNSGTAGARSWSLVSATPGYAAGLGLASWGDDVDRPACPGERGFRASIRSRWLLDTSDAAHRNRACHVRGKFLAVAQSVRRRASERTCFTRRVRIASGRRLTN
jgi:hypothetical protein